jgi:hypothetical protein
MVAVEVLETVPLRGTRVEGVIDTAEEGTRLITTL